MSVTVHCHPGHSRALVTACGMSGRTRPPDKNGVCVQVSDPFTKSGPFIRRSLFVTCRLVGRLLADKEAGGKGSRTRDVWEVALAGGSKIRSQGRQNRTTTPTHKYVHKDTNHALNLLIFVHRHLFFEVFDKSYFHLRCLVSSQLVAEKYYFHLHLYLRDINVSTPTSLETRTMDRD